MNLSKIKGFKTIIVSILTVALGLWEFSVRDGGLFEFLCDNFEVMCNYSEASFYGAVISVIGFLNMSLRMITTTPVGESE